MVWDGGPRLRAREAWARCLHSVAHEEADQLDVTNPS